MNKNLTLTKLVLGITVATLILGPALAAPRKSHSLQNRHYRAAPVQTYFGEPLGYGAGQSGPYHKDVLPDGTITGPISPDVNGG
jgi:hypothetical protein